MSIAHLRRRLCRGQFEPYKNGRMTLTPELIDDLPGHEQPSVEEAAEPKTAVYLVDLYRGVERIDRDGTVRPVALGVYVSQYLQVYTASYGVTISDDGTLVTNADIVRSTRRPLREGSEIRSAEYKAEYARRLESFHGIAPRT